MGFKTESWKNQKMSRANDSENENAAEHDQSINQSINQSKTSFNFEFVDSKIANISEENKSIK